MVGKTIFLGVSDTIYAKVLEDDSIGIRLGEVKNFAWVSEFAKTTGSNNETHYYDNFRQVIISSTGFDKYQCSWNSIWDIGRYFWFQYYNDTTRIFVDHERELNIMLSVIVIKNRWHRSSWLEI